MTVTEYGIGPIRAGMTVEQVAQAMGGGFGAPKGGTAGCTYAVLVKAPPGLAVMLQDGSIGSAHRIGLGGGQHAHHHQARQL
jgi:hypothetical protein